MLVYQKVSHLFPYFFHAQFLALHHAISSMPRDITRSALYARFLASAWDASGHPVPSGCLTVCGQCPGISLRQSNGGAFKTPGSKKHLGDPKYG